MAKAKKLFIALIASTIIPNGAALAQSANQIVGGVKSQQEKPDAAANTSDAATTPATPATLAPIVLPANAVVPPAPYVIKRAANSIAIPATAAPTIGIIRADDNGRENSTELSKEPAKSPASSVTTKPGVEVIAPPVTAANPTPRLVAEPIAIPESRLDMRYVERPVLSSTVKVGSSFGYRVDPFTGRAKFHSGVDLKAAWGDPVGCSLSGVVKFAGWHSGYGNLLIVDHGGGVTTHYAHLSSFAVAVGTRVTRGTIIAYAGSTGRSTSPHLHYEIRIDDNPVNPLNPLALDASSEFFTLHPTTQPTAPRVLSTNDNAGQSTTLQQKNN